MPYVLVSSNVAASGVVLKPAMEAISKTLAGALSKPESVVMVQLQLDQPMLFAASDAVRACVCVIELADHAIASLCPERGERVYARILTHAYVLCCSHAR